VFFFVLPYVEFDLPHPLLVLVKLHVKLLVPIFLLLQDEIKLSLARIQIFNKLNRLRYSSCCCRTDHIISSSCPYQELRWPAPSITASIVLVMVLVFLGVCLLMLMLLHLSCSSHAETIHLLLRMLLLHLLLVIQIWTTAIINVVDIWTFLVWTIRVDLL